MFYPFKSRIQYLLFAHSKHRPIKFLLHIGQECSGFNKFIDFLLMNTWMNAPKSLRAVTIHMRGQKLEIVDLLLIIFECRCGEYVHTIIENQSSISPHRYFSRKYIACSCVISSSHSAELIEP